MEVDVEISRRDPVTANSPDFVRFAQKTTETLLGPGGYREVRAPMMGAEDFSYLLQKWPGTMFFWASSRKTPHSQRPATRTACC